MCESTIFDWVNMVANVIMAVAAVAIPLVIFTCRRSSTSKSVK